MFAKFVVVHLFVLYWIQPCLGIKCYACINCKHDESIEELDCPEEVGQSCGKISFEANQFGHHLKQTIKGCLPMKFDESCESYILDYLYKSGFRPELIRLLEGSFKDDTAEVNCDFCDEDLCNSSGQVVPLALLTVTSVLLKLLFFT